MANVLSLANFTAANAAVNGTDRNAVRVYEREKLIRYSVALSGSYVAAVRGSNVGEVIDLTKALAGTPYQAEQYWGYRGPVRGYVLTPGNTGYGLTLLPGADAFHWLLKIFSAVATELTAGTYAAQAPTLLTDTDIVLEFTGLAFD